jgi:hypothetical protein
VKTNVKPSLIADYVGLASEIDRKDVYRAVVTYPLIHSGSDVRGSILLPDRNAIRKFANRIFTDPGTRPKGFETLPEESGGPKKQAVVVLVVRRVGDPATHGQAHAEADEEADAQADRRPRPPRRRPRPRSTPEPTPAPTPTPTPEPTPEPSPS